MASSRKLERREVQHRSLVLEPSFLFRLPPRQAWPVILSLMVVIGLADAVSPKGIWFGPAYLAVLALAAWTLGCRLAIVIGLSIVGFKFAAGGMALYPTGMGLLIPNVVLRIISIAIVVGFIGVARRACEREWRSARTDPLTGAWNRQAFFEIIGAVRGAGGCSALIYADLDGLKQLNDMHGHAQGDQSLKNFAETIRKTIRQGDVFARMGGDEFVIFMNLKDEDAGRAVARRLHAAINTGEPNGLYRLKCSVGLLVLPHGSKSIDEELKAADHLMYIAKQSRSSAVVATAADIGGTFALMAPVQISGDNGQVTEISESDGSFDEGAVRKERRVPTREPRRAA